jgi:hypothetical protein
MFSEDMIWEIDVHTLHGGDIRALDIILKLCNLLL